MLSQGYQDGFRDGWSDQRNGRKPSIVPTNDFYGREYRLGYDEGVRAYTQRLKGRSEGRSGASSKEVA
jgi:hypothetical protein